MAKIRRFRHFPPFFGMAKTSNVCNCLINVPFGVITIWSVDAVLANVRRFCHSREWRKCPTFATNALTPQWCTRVLVMKPKARDTRTPSVPRTRGKAFWLMNNLSSSASFFPKLSWQRMAYQVRCCCDVHVLRSLRPSLHPSHAHSSYLSTFFLSFFPSSLYFCAWVPVMHAKYFYGLYVVSHSRRSTSSK